MPERVQHIDVAKGISIFFVAMFHSKLKFYYPDIIGPMSLFRMPLFFFLSGVFFSWLLEPKAFLIKKAEALLKPYFVVLFIIFLVGVVLKKPALFWQLKGILYGNGDTIQWVPLWFLTHLFAVYLFVYILFYFLKFNSLPVWLKVVVLVTFMLVGIFYIDLFWYKDIHFLGYFLQLPGLPFSLDIILITSCFFVCGVLLNDLITRFRPRVLLILFSIVAFLMISVFTGAHIDLNKRVYDDGFYATLGAVFGIYIALSISWYISKIELISYIPLRLGEASLYILMFHGFIQREFYNYLAEGVTEEFILIGVIFFSLFLSVSIPLGIRWVVLRSDFLSLAFLPFKSNKLVHRMISARH